jgi:hypothetical protein
MPETPSPNYGLIAVSDGDAIEDYPANDQAKVAALDDLLTPYDEGAIASRPVSSPGTPGIAGREYRATDTGQLFKDYGTGWIEIAIAAPGLVGVGGVAIATVETRTVNTFALLATPDRVQNVVVGANTVLGVLYTAQWKASGAGTSGEAAIFCGANQLKIERAASAPLTQAALLGSDATAYSPLSSFVGGLASASAGAVDTGARVTTGQVLGTLPKAGITSLQSLGGSGSTLPADMPLGGACLISGLAAGTYDISVQFRNITGTVSVRNRRLWIYRIETP